MSGLSFLNILLSVIHLIALAAFVTACGVSLLQVIKLFSKKKMRWPYQLVEVCIQVLCFSTIALWLTSLPDALFLSGLPARHFSIFGIVNLELLVLATGALITVVYRAQNRYPARKKLVRGFLDSLVLRLMVSCFIGCLIMAAFQLTPDNLVPQQFAIVDNNMLVFDLFLLLFLVILFVFVLSLALNDTWINYRFTRGRGAGSFKFAENDLNLLHTRHLR